MHVRIHVHPCVCVCVFGSPCFDPLLATVGNFAVSLICGKYPYVRAYIIMTHVHIHCVHLHICILMCSHICTLCYLSHFTGADNIRTL